MDSTTRRNLRRNWIDLLYDFASPKMQSWWLGGAPRDVNVSYVELMCCYFDDLGLASGLEEAVRKGWMSEAEARATAEFHREARGYREPSRDHRAILADPSWARVVRAAQRAWCELRALAMDPEDVAAMNDLEAKWGIVTPVDHARRTMSDRALLRTQRAFGYAAVTAVLVPIATLIAGLDGSVFAILLVAALLATLGWWWFGHWLEVRRIAASFRDPASRSERDTES